MSMSYSIETRVPYLDWNVASMILRMPALERATRDKSVIRQLVRRLGGQTAADVPKRGLSMPTGEWLRARPHDVRSIVLSGALVDLMPKRELGAYLDYLLRTDGSREDQILHALVSLAIFGRAA
jgi:hypothetical protein